MNKVYVASKLHHAPMWRSLRDAWRPHVVINSRWIDTTDGEPDTHDNAPNFWKIDIEDVRNADFLICFGNREDVLRGALYEAGIAVGLYIPVLCVGDSPSFGTWQYGPGVIRYDVLDKAYRHIVNATFRKKPE